LIDIAIPDFGRLKLNHLVMDYNGTLAEDGILIDGVVHRLQALAGNLHLHVVTADTHGQVRRATAGIECTVHILAHDRQAQGKRTYIRRLGPEQTVSIGNGRNDALMLDESALGIAVIQTEGAFAGVLTAADVVCTTILSALDLLLYPLRLTATLRS